MKRLSIALMTVMVFSGFAGSAITAAEPAQSTPASETASADSSDSAKEGEKEAPEAGEKTKAEEKKETEEEKKQKAEAEKAKKAQRKAQHLQKIGNMNFDRRPSAVLKAWCGLAAEEATEAEKKQKEKEAAAKAAGETAETEPAPPAVVLSSPPVTAPVTAAAPPTVMIPAQLGSLSPQQREAIEKAAQSGAMVAGPSPAAAGGESGDTGETDPFDKEIETFAKNVTLGKWAEVKEYIASLEKDEGETLYRRLLTTLHGEGGENPPVPGPAMGMPGPVAFPAGLSPMARGKGEGHVITLDDVFSLAGAAPFELEKDETLGLLAGLVRRAVEQGHVVEDFVERLNLDVEKPDDQAVFSRRQAAHLLCKSGYTIHAGVFLPEIEIAEANKDHEALNLLSQYQLALYGKDKKIAGLEKAWRVTQAILADKDTIELKQKQEALARAVELAPRIREEIGRKWLEESFTEQPRRGMEIVATIGSAAAQSLERHREDPQARLNSLALQTTAVEALIKAAPPKADEWRPALAILATNWLNEAAISHRLDTSTSFGPTMQRDPFGNIFFFDTEDEARFVGRDRNDPRPIRSSELLRIKPSDAWLELLPDLRPRLAMLYAQLLLKVNEENAAFPYIEQLAKTHPQEAETLAAEFLRVWTRNHDPNAERNRTRSYMFMYGFERKAEGIPLTRSKQERNLEELSGWVKRLDTLPLEKLDERLLASAFTTCHSEAEIYRLDAIEQIFGPIDTLKPKTLAELMRQMRINLVGQWRKPDLQKKNATNRKQKDIEAEVLRGYQLARAVVEAALEKHPQEWRLVLAKAAMAHDENNYRCQLQKDPQYSARRREALAEFALAARLYADEVPELTEDEIGGDAFDTWFYASLGECDLEKLSEDTSADPKQFSLIRQALLDLPGEAAAKHMDMFANSIFTRMSAVSPAVKFRYLRGAFEIVADHKQAHEARKVYDYYKDLVTELKLEARVDGSDTVARDAPFGVFVDIVHTKEIERESGGFGRYLQNQNSANYSYYNYGRPTTDYRDRFQEVVKQALEEHFEILSVTFQSDKVHSRATKEYGWRTTPYAYLLLKPRGGQIDKIQPLRLDFDFLDTSGYVVLPVESPAVPIEVVEEGAPRRPVADLEIVQILDERQAADGKLILEIKAVGHGLIPPLEEIVDIRPKDFEVVATDDEEVAVSKFAEDTETNCVVSERSWLVTLKAKEGLPQRPAEFAFAVPKVETAKSLTQRYDDADLVSAESVVTLQGEYGEPSRAGYWIIAGSIAAAVLLFVVVSLLLRAALRGREPAVSYMPEEITPFSVLSILWAAQRHDLSEERRQELLAAIRQIEGYYFAERGNGAKPAVADSTDGRNGEPDLDHLARIWSKTLQRQMSSVRR